METTKFEQKGFLYQLYLMVYKGKNLPTDTCSFRGRLIVSIVISTLLLPVTIARAIYRAIIYRVYEEHYNQEDKLTNGILGFLTTTFAVVLPTLIGNMGLRALLTSTFKQGDVNILLWDNYTLTIIVSFIAGLLGIALVLGALIGIVYIICEKLVPWNSARLDKKRQLKWEKRRLEDLIAEPVEYKPTQAAILYTSLKERFCKKIDWV